MISLKSQLSVFLLFVSLISCESFAADHHAHSPTIETQHQPSPSAGSYKKISVYGGLCATCFLATAVNPTLGACSFAVVGAYYLYEHWSDFLGHSKSSTTKDFSEKPLVQTNIPNPPSSPLVDDQEDRKPASAASDVNVPPALRPQPRPLLSRTMSSVDMRNPIKELKLTLLEGVIRGLDSLSFDHMALDFAQKRSLDTIEVNLEQFAQNHAEYSQCLDHVGTDDAIQLKNHLNNLYRHFIGGTTLLKRLVVFSILTSSDIVATEEDYLRTRQTHRALASFIERLVTKFKDVETGKGVASEGVSVVQLGTLMDEFVQASSYARVFELTELDLIHIAEITVQIRRVDRKDRIQEAFDTANSKNELTENLRALIEVQNNKERSWETSEACAADGISLHVFLLEGFYRLLPTKVSSAKNILVAEGITYEKQQGSNHYKEVPTPFYLQYWMNNSFTGEPLVLDERNQKIMKAINAKHYRLVAIAFGKDKSPNSTERGYYLIPTSLQAPRLTQHDDYNEPVIYRVYSRYTNNQEEPAVFKALLDKVAQQ